MEGQINGFTILATMVNFVIFYFILRHFLFNPVNKTLDSRKEEVSGRLKNAEENEKKAELLRMENEKKLQEAAKEGKSIVESYKSKAEVTSKNIIEEAGNEANSILDRTQKELQREKEKAEEELKIKAVDLAVLMTSKALGEALNEEQQKRLIEDFIAKVGM